MKPTMVLRPATRGGPQIAVRDDAEAADDDVLQANSIGIGYYAGEVRTRGLVLGHDPP